MKTIIIATDYSPAALNAVKYGADMALAIDARVMLFHAYHIPVSYGEVPIIMDMEGSRKIAEKELDKISLTLSSAAGGKLKINTEVRIGEFFRELKTLCEEVKPYAVVLGSQGTSSAERFLFGSHATFAMKHLMWPLITVPPNASFKAVKKVGLACDFNEVVASTPVEEIKLLVSDFHAELHILHTGKNDEFDPELVFESGLLQEMLGPLKPKYHFITHDNIDEGIMDFADKNNLDLLLVLPKRHNLPEKIIHKSHTKQLVLHSHVPVMALHQ